MPVARVVLQRTLVRGTQCPNNRQGSSAQSPPVSNEPSMDIDLSQAHHRNEKLKQKYDYSGRLIYHYGEGFWEERRAQ